MNQGWQRALHRWSRTLLLVLFVASACHKRPPPAAPIRTTPSPPAAPTRPPAPAPPPTTANRPPPAALTEAELFQRKSLDELNANTVQRNAFFDYDQNTLRDEAKRALQQDAQWLMKWPSTVVRIDGHCDERGSEEYNLALGDRRATAVKIYLVSLGVRSDRIQPRSLGKEVPFCRESGETCWSENRRGHFVITSK